MTLIGVLIIVGIAAGILLHHPDDQIAVLFSKITA